MRRVVDVIWIEHVETESSFECELWLACGHKALGACTLYQTMCFICPEVAVGDQGPLDHWMPMKTVRFAAREAGGVA